MLKLRCNLPAIFVKIVKFDTNIFGTPDEICDGLADLHAAGVDYVLVQLECGRQQLRRFAHEVAENASIRP